MGLSREMPDVTTPDEGERPASTRIGISIIAGGTG